MKATRSKSVTPASLLSAVKSMRTPGRRDRPLVVAGPPGLVQILVEDLGRGGVAAAVLVYAPPRNRTVVQVAGLVGVFIVLIALIVSGVAKYNL